VIAEKYSTVTSSDIQAFQRDGTVRLRKLFKPGDIELLRANLAHSSSRAKIASRPDAPSFFIGDFCNWQCHESYRHFIVESGIAEVAGNLMQSRPVRGGKTLNEFRRF